jgi:ABC-type Zn uptake system ZnuABC Zn-binding protein ZnuA
MLMMLTLLLTGCAALGTSTTVKGGPLPLALPTVEPMAHPGPLRVLATTSLIGDVVGRVGGAAIELTTLMGPGQDPHSYQPGAADLSAAADADLIFVNGWDLEEGLVDDLATIQGAAVAPISAGIIPRALDAGQVADPHVWQSVPNVYRWVDNVRDALGAADPANAATYAANAAAYRVELEALEAEVRAQTATIPAEQRVLVANHDTFGYFAEAYGFRVLGSVVPGASTLAEPTAANLAELARVMAAEGVCSLFIETTASDQLARTLGDELSECEAVHVFTLYSDALGPPGSGVDSYIGMMRANVATLVEALRS